MFKRKKKSVGDLIDRLCELNEKYSVAELSAKELHDYVFEGIDPK